MYARAVDDAAAGLRELRHQEREAFGLGLAALALAVLAAGLHHVLAVPLFLGGLTVGASGIRALWRRWDLVDRLSAEPDAYSIPEILECASREATAERRRGHAALIRRTLKNRSACDARVVQVAGELDALARELEDRELRLEPACAVACRRLVSEPGESPLFDERVPAEDLRACIHRIRLGFTSRERPHCGSPPRCGKPAASVPRAPRLPLV